MSLQEPLQEPYFWRYGTGHFLSCPLLRNSKLHVQHSINHMLGCESKNGWTGHYHILQSKSYSGGQYLLTANMRLSKWHSLVPHIFLWNRFIVFSCALSTPILSMINIAKHLHEVFFPWIYWWFIWSSQGLCIYLYRITKKLWTM